MKRVSAKSLSIPDICDCRQGCGACCIAPSIVTPFVGMPEGKPAGVFCVHLDEDFRCRLYGSPERPSFCVSLKPSLEMCGRNREEAMEYLAQLEKWTSPRETSETVDQKFEV
ncbi:MAG: YkgJ family cysteine cluster protein [Brevinematales bacterium]|nr:YkgJ family cysteine cluster protein [Brevinematales bacterium]